MAGFIKKSRGKNVEKGSRDPFVSPFLVRIMFPGGDFLKIDVILISMMLSKEDTMREKVEEAIAKIRPSLQMDGGDIELVDIVDNVVKVRLQGACGSCPMSVMTLKMGVERIVKEMVPEIKSVEAV